MAISFSYGTYSFDPKPLFTIGKEYIKTPSQMGLGTKYTVTLQGQIIPATGKIPGGSPQAGLTDVFTSVDELRDAFDTDYKLLYLQCGTSDPILSGHPRVTDFSIENANDNYVIRAEYSITLELPALVGGGFDAVGPSESGVASGVGVSGLDFSSDGIISYSDDFSVEFLDERVGGVLSLDQGEVPTIFSVQRSISAQGDSQVDSAGVYTQPWERAREFVKGKVGYPEELATLSGLLCPGAQVSNNFRTTSVNKTEGSVSVNETYIAMTGSGLAYEELQINIAQSHEDVFTKVTVDGTINGLTSINYSGCGWSSDTPKFNNAISFWTGTVSGRIFARAAAVYGATLIQSGHITSSLNVNTLNETVGYNPIAGNITYSYTYDNRPQNCYQHAITEDITFSEQEPADIFASITILGKINGPLLQSIGTVGQRTRSLSINAILPPVSDCSTTGAAGGASFFNAPDVYDALVLNYASILTHNYTQVFVTDSSKTWEPKTGRFSLTQSWTVGSC